MPALSFPARVREAQALYKQYDFEVTTRLWEVAQSEYSKVRADVRAGKATTAELLDAKVDFYAMRGLHEQVTRYGK